jgi:ferredoxin-NADP reductase
MIESRRFPVLTDLGGWQIDRLPVRVGGWADEQSATDNTPLRERTRHGCSDRGRAGTIDALLSSHTPCDCGSGGMFPSSPKEGAMADRFETTVLQVERCDEDTLMMKLQRPPGYEAHAGQWFRLTLGEGDDSLTRTFTDAAAPSDEWLEVMTRLSPSAFKVALGGLVAGDRAKVIGPGGRLTIAGDVRKIVFLVGGVGITPARSILRAARNEGRTFEDAVLFYGNRDDACVPYLDELMGMGDMGVSVVPVYEEASDEWVGERGLITADLVRRHVMRADGRPSMSRVHQRWSVRFGTVLDELGSTWRIAWSSHSARGVNRRMPTGTTDL